ncbi:MAG: ABC transporter ATP-binding protein [Ruminococcaceae bacterium]|nr:ABC transporter ATP-binding protein [Oscillospiraceae bacterium]
MIEVKGLVKKYGEHTAVNGISFTVEQGKIYGFLGPNGAGKSTTMNIITGCLSATEGSVTVNGHDILKNPREAKKCIGYLPEIPPLYGDMTPEEYLTFVAEAKKVGSGYVSHQVREALEITGLTDVSDRLIRNLSKGYKQRVGIAQAMLGSPDIIILDEPTVGLDPKQILEIRELIRRLGESKTVILSSHILAEISAVCERVMVISHGNLIANDTIEHLEELAGRSDKLHIEVRGESSAVIERLLSIDGVIDASGYVTESGTVSAELELEKDKDIRDDIFFAMSDMKCPIISMNYYQTSLEDIFLALTDDDIRPDENGDLPTVEEILSGKIKKDYSPSYEDMSDAELAHLVSSVESDSGMSDTGEDTDSESTNESDDGDYKPLFGGKD